MDKAQQDALKKAAGIEAAKLIEDGMIAGLGTGSTVKFLVDELGRRHQEEGLEFTGVTTSRRTQAQAESYGIKIVDIDDVDHIDVTIDGADEVDKNFNGIKGGGAALLWEKIVATNSNQIVWIVDESKVVDTIGKFPLPVEVIPFGAAHPLAALLDDRTHLKPPFRLIVKVATRSIVHVLPDRGNTHAQLRNPPAATTAITGIFAQYVALYSGNFW